MHYHQRIYITYQFAIGIIAHVQLLSDIRHIILTRPNKPDAESAREVGNTREEVALGNVLAGGLPLLLVLGIPGRQLDLGKLPALRFLDALDLGLLVLDVLLAVGSLGVGGGGDDDGRGMLTLVRHVAIGLCLCLRWEIESYSPTIVK